MGYIITCCNCKENINIEEKELFFVVQPTIFEDYECKRTTYGGFKQLILCKKCLRDEKMFKKIKLNWEEN